MTTEFVQNWTSIVLPIATVSIMKCSIAFYMHIIICCPWATTNASRCKWQQKSNSNKLSGVLCNVPFVPYFLFALTKKGQVRSISSWPPSLIGIVPFTHTHTHTPLSFEINSFIQTLCQRHQINQTNQKKRKKIDTKVVHQNTNFNFKWEDKNKKV